MLAPRDGDNDRPAATDDIEAILSLNGGGVRRRRLLLALAVVFLALAGAVYYLVVAQGESDTLRYRTAAVTRGDLTVLVTATGTLEPTNKVDISSELSGIVRSVAVDFNDRVKVGQVLAELDTDKLRATVESSRAKLMAARAHAAEAEATLAEKVQELQRKQSLAERGVASGQDLDTARAAHDRAAAALESARADITAASADLKLNETNLQKTCICSPINGVVLDRNVDPGQVVAASLQAPVLFTLAEDLSKMEVQVDVDEADVGKVREGQLASFSVDAHPERSFQARIREVRYGSQVVQGVVTYKAVLTTDNADLLLRPGMTATAEIIVREEKDALTVPNEAFRFTPASEEARDSRSFIQRLLPGRPPFRAPTGPATSGAERQLWVLRDGAASPVRVVTGATDGARTQIVAGPLQPGDAVIVDSAETGG